jgi:hypothetical protein
MQKCFNFDRYYKFQVKALSLLHCNIGRSEKVLSKEHRFGSTTSDVGQYQYFELDTLELARRGRQEQARVIAELTSEGRKHLARWIRQAYRFAAERLAQAPERVARPHMQHSLKGN